MEKPNIIVRPDEEYELRPGWTKQDMIDLIEDWVPEQGSLDREGRCRYRGLGDARCAAGAFIPDECYGPGIECISIGALYNRRLRDVDWPISLVGMRRMQAVHDTFASRARGDSVTECLVEWVRLHVAEG